MRKIGLILAIAAASPLYAAYPRDGQAGLNRLANELGYQWSTVDNHPACPTGIKDCFLATITLQVPRDVPVQLPNKLGLYYNFVSRLPLVESDVFEDQLINGDLHRLTLKPGAELVPGTTHVIKLWGTGAHFSKAYVMPNAYLAAVGLKPKVIAASRVRIDPDTGLEQLPFVTPMLDEKRLATASPTDQTRWLTAERAFALQASRTAPAATGVVILPKPIKAVLGDGPAVDLMRGIRLQLHGVEPAAIAPALAALGVPANGLLPLSIRVSASTAIPAEGYRLSVTSSGIDIMASSAAGANYALRSLAQQATFDHGRMRPLTIEDAPHYPFRGLHIDLARNFHSRAELLKLLEAMAAYKLNKLHLHLADDEGWRIEIPGLPELTAIGSRRCHDLTEQHCLLPQLGAGPEGTSSVNGFLSRADYIAILRAAAARNVEVIPSIDTPGHSRAAIRSMEARFDRLSKEGRSEEAAQYRLRDPADRTEYRSIQNYNDNTLNVCIPATYRFVDKVVDAIVAMHRDAGVPLRTFHLGADETAGAWVKSPACAAMIAENGGDAHKLTPRFIERVANGLAARGIEAAGWSDGIGHTDPARMPRKVQSNIWGLMQTGAVGETHEALNRDWDVVLSIPTFAYLDMPYAPHPDEGGYDWASRGIDTYLIYGFMPDNVPANAATAVDLESRPRPEPDGPVRQPGRTIAGIQAQLWSETVRTDAQVDYMLFPRLLAFAERAWTPADWTPAYTPGASYAWQDRRIDFARLGSGWKDFAGRVTAQFPLLDRAGIAYRVAPPGARVVSGVLQANSAFPGTRIQYRTSGRDWRDFVSHVRVTGRTQLRAVSGDGRRFSRIVEVGAGE